MQQQLLQDETAVVTGGSSGIGRAICLRFAEEGADVVIADRRKEPREGGVPTNERIEAETDANVAFVECDVSRKDDISEAVEVATEFGDLDIMVNNAGIFRGEEFLDVTADEMDQMIAVNLKGTMFGAQVAIEHMLESGGGELINLSSVAGLSIRCSLAAR
jgi:NAD(P)-dependent dehydrogenase (short-subunit alcohol dehydrogenase family)